MKTKAFEDELHKYIGKIQKHIPNAILSNHNETLWSMDLVEDGTPKRISILQTGAPMVNWLKGVLWALEYKEQQNV